MAAIGIIGDSGRQADAMADFALEMLEIVRAVGEKFGERLELRIGIGIGPVISGVIGYQKICL